MGNYILKITNPSGVSGTVNPDKGFQYSFILNEMNEADIRISGTGVVKRGLLKLGSEVEITRDGTLEFYGLVDDINYLKAGAIKIHCTGYELRLAQEDGTFSGSPWKTTASATIFNSVIGESSYWNAGTVEAGYDVDFRLNDGQSLWNAISNLRRKTEQDVSLDYTLSTPEVSILDHAGSSSAVASLNEGLDIEDVRVNFALPKGNHVKVFGKGDGTNQVKAEAEDATSIASYGRITRKVIDRSIVSEGEASRMASAELSKTKDPAEIYDFEIINPDRSFNLGDHLTLYSQDQDLTGSEVRIVAITRGEREGGEYLTLQVSNVAFSQALIRGYKQLANLEKTNIDFASYMQGSTNEAEWGAGINAKNGAPLKVGFYIPESFKDEAGNFNINSLVADFDIDPYKKGVGTASFTGGDPQVQNQSGDDDNTISGDTGSDSPPVSGSTDNESPGVSGTTGDDNPYVTWGTSGAAWSGTNIGSDSNSSVSCSSGTWTGVASVNTTGSNDALYCNFYVNGVSGGREDIIVKVYNSGILSATSSETGLQCGDWDDASHVKLKGISAGTDGSSDYVSISVYPMTGSVTVDGYMRLYKADHSHNVGNYQVDLHDHSSSGLSGDSHDHNSSAMSADLHDHSSSGLSGDLHDHPKGSYDINASDIDSLSIGDDVSDASSVNSSSVAIYLDYYNTSTSSWDTKHTVTPSGTMGEDVDISNSGVYPDSSGYWRIRVNPNSSSPDYIQSIVRLKFHLDS